MLQTMEQSLHADLEADAPVDRGKDELSSLIPRLDQQMLVTIPLRTADDLIPHFLSRSWGLVYSPESRFITSDHPVAVWQEPNARRPPMGVGVGNADLVYVALDPRHALALYRVRSWPMIVTVYQTATARTLNTWLAAAAYEWIFFHPDHPETLDGISARGEKPLLQLNGRLLYRDRSKDRTRRSDG